MKAIILAAGKGTRLYPLSGDKPKSMIKVNSVPIIEYQIESYLFAKFKEEDISIVIGYKAEILEEYIINKYPKINIIINKDFSTTNNMYSLYLAMKKIHVDDILFINNADCIYDKNIISGMNLYPNPNLIAADKGAYSVESMKITLDKKSIIQSIAKTIDKDNAYGNSIDLYKMNKETYLIFLNIIKEYIEVNKDLNSWTEVALDILLKKVEFDPYNIEGKKWIEIDNYADLLQADLLFNNFDLNKKKCIVLDLDGTIYLGNTPIKGAIDFLKDNKKYDIYFMTNNTSKNLFNYVEKLNSFGLSYNKSKIISPLIPLVHHINDKQYKHIYIVGNSNFSNFLLDTFPEIMITNDPKLCEAVVLAYDTEINYEKMKRASLLLNNTNIDYIATHEDNVCPTEYGPIPDIGSFISLFETSTNRTPDIILGKPNQVLLESILTKYKKDEIVIVGDRLYTDKVLAENAGIDFTLVLSGETKRDDLEDLIKFPALVINNLGCLQSL